MSDEHRVPAGKTPGSPLPATAVPRLTWLDERRSDVQDRSARHVEERLDDLVRAYRARFGHLVGADQAKELFPDYAASPAHRTPNDLAVHNAASALAQRVFDAILSEPVRPGGQPIAIFSGGGTGSGKTTSFDLVIHESVADAHVVYDSTLSNLASAARNIDAALSAGLDVLIVLLDRDVVEAFHATITRASTMGRPVTMLSHLHTHRRAPIVFEALRTRYGSHVGFAVIANGTEGRFFVRTEEWQPRRGDWQRARATMGEILAAANIPAPLRAAIAGREHDVGDAPLKIADGDATATGMGSIADDADGCVLASDAMPSITPASDTPASATGRDVAAAQSRGCARKSTASTRGAGRTAPGARASSFCVAPVLGTWFLGPAVVSSTMDQGAGTDQEPRPKS